MSTHNLSELIERLPGLRVAVVGDLMLDSYYSGSAERICREAPVPVVQIHERDDQPGGAANAAANLRALGAEVTLLGAVGDDAEGGLLAAALERMGVSPASLVVEPGRITLAKARVSAAEQLLVRFDQGSTTQLSPAAAAALAARLEAAFRSCDAVLISDYGYGVLTPAMIARVGALQARYRRVLVADSKRLRAYRQVGLTAAKPNFEEAARLIGPRRLEGAPDRVAAVAAEGASLLDAVGARLLAVTLDQDGGLIFERGRPPYRTYATPAPHSRAAGAGDTFISALTMALAAGAPAPAAAELAAAAAAVVVGRSGTAVCELADLREQTAAAGVFCATPERLAERVAALRRQGRTIAFTNGCFDIIHPGHIHLLSQAKAQADTLIVALNSDAGVRRLKGHGRPVNQLHERAQVLGALSSVDCVVAFDAETPAELIRIVRPDVFVKGDDYRRDQIPEADLVESLGGRVLIVPALADSSTTGLIARIRAEPRARAVGE